jgi:hypothetical protein
VVTAIAVLFGAYKQTSRWALLLTLPEIAWEASLAMRLVFTGGRPPRRLGSPLGGHFAARPRHLLRA